MICKDNIISEVIENYPDTLEVFFEYWLWCAWCSIASFETIEEGAIAHGFNDDEVTQLIEDLNEALQS